MPHKKNANSVGNGDFHLEFSSLYTVNYLLHVQIHVILILPHPFNCNRFSRQCKLLFTRCIMFTHRLNWI